MKSVYKLLIDIGPLAVFFYFYSKNGLQASILPFMIATVIAVLFSYIHEKKIPIMPTNSPTIIFIDFTTKKPLRVSANNGKLPCPS